MASSAAASTFSGIQRSIHDVFLSFRGTDTRTSFAGHLLAALNRQGFSTFRDDTKLRRGEDIGSELLKAIEVSRVSIIVFSKNYAASRWCLDELVKIMECKRNFDQVVLPIFYDVDPSDVRAQLGSYSEAFAKHEDMVREGTSSMERVQSWRATLTQAANLSGYELEHMVNGDEAKLINEIVKDIINRLDRVYSNVADYPVGIESRVQQLTKLLKLGSDDVRIVAVWGVGGIGKTTIAKATFNCICKKFDGSSFLADVSQTSTKLSGVVKLQEQLLSNILMNETYNLDNYHHGIEVIKQKIGHQRVLLVLDDIDDLQQLKKLGINRSFFCSGSRIIITTRNMTSIASLQVNSVYSPNELNADESLKLFSWNAFKTNYPEKGYQYISKEIMAYAEGIPLVLEVLGSFLLGRSIVEWQSESDKLKIIPNGDIQQKLKISFDALDDINKELFLDIAFFFIGKEKYFTIKVLEDSGYFPESGIGELARRCLVRFDEWGNKRLIRMHDVLRDMGREIVRQESLKEPGKRSRLWFKEEVLQVLRDISGTKAIEGISLQLPAVNKEHVNTNGFANMRSLRLLHLNNLHRISGKYITASRNLIWLCWHGFPLEEIPASVYMENLVAIDLHYSKLKQIWKGPKRLDRLRFLNLSHSYSLIKTPDFSGLKSLEILSLNDCTSLVKVHNSIGGLDNLLTLNVANCINLREVPWTSVFMLKSLETIDFSGCSKLGELAECKEGVSKFWQQLTKRLEYVPITMASIVGFSCLRELNLANCNIEHVPSNIGSLITLLDVNLSGNKFCSLPSSFSHLSLLENLRLDGCLQLKSLAYLPNNVMDLRVNNCISLESISVGKLHSIPPRNLRLEFVNCPKLDCRSIGSNTLMRQIHCQKNVQEAARYTHSYPDGEHSHDMQFEVIGRRRLSFLVPPFVANKVQGFILYLFVSSPSPDPNIHWLEICNKSKTMGESYYWPLDMHDDCKTGDNVFIFHHPINYHRSITLKAGDEAEVSVTGTDLDFKVKRLGLTLIYDDADDKYLQSLIENM